MKVPRDRFLCLLIYSGAFYTLLWENPDFFSFVLCSQSSFPTLFFLLFAYMTSSPMEIFLFFVASWHFSGLVCLSMFPSFFSSSFKAQHSKLSLESSFSINWDQKSTIPNQLHNNLAFNLVCEINLSHPSDHDRQADDDEEEEGRGKANGIRHGSFYLSRPFWKAGYIARFMFSSLHFISKRNFFSTNFRSSFSLSLGSARFDPRQH